MMFEEYIKELLLWNKAHNLVSKNEKLQEHLEDSLSLAGYAEKYDYVVDVGSGGGFPVVPLAMMFPEKHFTATDVVEKKIAFLRWCAAKFDLNMDVENPGKGLLIERESLIISRAFSSVKNIIAWRDKHAPNSRDFALLKGAKAAAEMQEAGVDDYIITESPRGCVVSFTSETSGKV